jgi:peptide-methionine (S)-S-oxide reductase
VNYSHFKTRSKLLLILSSLILSGLLFMALSPNAKKVKKEKKVHTTTEVATLGGGCFWCLEAIYKRVKGVTQVSPGYSGGTVANPTYEQVSSGTTGHAEVVQVQFDPDIITYEEILDIFWQIHDPTQLNRQGNDVGTQYRSVIFYHTPEQQKTAEASKRNLKEQKIFDAPIVTQIVPFRAFFPAEDYHKNYYDTNPNQPYCQLVISPKLNKFKKHFTQYLK